VYHTVRVKTRPFAWKTNGHKMLEVETNHQIILLYYRERLSIRRIAKQLDLHRNTVKARIDLHERYRSSSAEEKEDPGCQVGQYLQKGHTYDSSGRGKRKLTADITDIIHVCLQENEAKRQDGRSKQRLRRIDIHERILAAGHSISYSVICDYIQKKLGGHQEAFIRQDYSGAQICEFDWAEVKLKLDGNYRRYYLAVFTSAFSNYRFAVLFQRQDSLAFKEAHIVFFDHTGGVFHQMVYDNMRVAIAQFVGKTEKQPTASLLELSRWYQFQWRFCNTARGNEKGHVERSVEYVRRKVFAFKDEFTSFQEAQQYLSTRVLELNARDTNQDEGSPATRLELERAHLYAYPGKMECFSGDHLRVDKYATICFGTNRYSVPDHLSGRMVFVKIYASYLRIYENNTVVCTHQRTYERHGWQIDLNHYLTTLHRKPGAVAGSVALQQAPQWLKSIYTAHFQHEPRAFIELLQYCQLHDITDQRFQNCVERLARQYPSGITAEYVMATIGNQPVESIPASNSLVLTDPIELRSRQNLLEMASLMNFN
jgi:transposase-like protein